MFSPVLASRVRRSVLGLCLAAFLAGATLIPANAAERRDSASPVTVAQSGGGAATIQGLSTHVLWPNPRDAAGPRKVTARFTIDRPGNYTIKVTEGAVIHAWLDLGKVEASSEPRAWSWNGRDEYGDVVERGNYRIEIVENHPGGSFANVARSNVIDVHNGTETLVVRDRRRESGTGMADVAWFTLANGHDRAQVVWDFRKKVKPKFTQAVAGLDVDKSRKGYYVSTTRKRGKMQTRIYVAVLGTDEGEPKRVSCKSVRTKLQARRLTVTIPRSCLRRGGKQMRAFYGASANRGRSNDYGPDNGSYWTSWTTYEKPK